MIAVGQDSGASPAAELAFEHLILMARRSRSGEVRCARWDEIDLDSQATCQPDADRRTFASGALGWAISSLILRNNLSRTYL